MRCVECGQTEKPTEVIASALSVLKDNLAEDDTTITIPLPDVLLDVAAYRFVYDVNLGAGQPKLGHAFWDNQEVRRILLHLRFDEHLCTHKRSCFKKGCECRFFFPFLARADINNVQRLLQQKKSARQFKLAPQSRTCSVNVSPNDQVSTTRRMKCRVTQLPVISSDAITGHKLQGLTKDNLVVYSWNKSTNWIYVVLSRVRTLSGLFLVRRLKLADIKPTSRDYLSFLRRIRKLEQQEFRRCAMLKDL